MIEDSGVVLTEHEREVLTALASIIDDDWLAYQLMGGPPPPPRPSLPRWLAPALLLLGMFVAIATFTSWWWVGGLGLVLMGLGGWLTWRDSLEPRLPLPDPARTVDKRDTR